VAKKKKKLESLLSQNANILSSVCLSVSDLAIVFDTIHISGLVVTVNSFLKARLPPSSPTPPSHIHSFCSLLFETFSVFVYRPLVLWCLFISLQEKKNPELSK